MPWFYVDDGFSDSKPVLEMPDRYRLAACGLWVLAGAWSAKEETDGHIPEGKLKQLGATPKLVEVLTSSVAPLWQRDDNSRALARHLLGSNTFRNWGKWQPTHAELVEQRRKDAERQRKHRRKGRGVLNSDDAMVSRRDTDVTDEECHGVTNGVTEQGCHAVTPPLVTPSRPRGPDPTLIGNSPLGATVASVGGSGGEGPNGRGTRLPDGWEPPPEVVAQMRSDHPHVNLALEHAKFADYWRAKTGKDATKRDWTATWRNWIRRAAETPQRNHAATRNFASSNGIDDKVNAWMNMPIPSETDNLKELP